MTPAFVDPSLLGDDPDPGWPFKLDAFINVVRHGGRHLALEEGTPPYEVTADARHRRPLRLRRRAARRHVRPPQDRPGHRRDGRVPLRRRGAVPDVGDDRRRRRRHASRPAVGRRRRRGVHDPRLRHHASATSCWSSGPLRVRPRRHDDAAATRWRGSPSWAPASPSSPATGRARPDGCTPTRSGPGTTPTPSRTATRSASTSRGRSAPSLLMAAAGPAATSGPGSPGPRSTRPAGRSTLHHLDDTGTEFPRIDDRRTGRAHRYVTVAGRSGDRRCSRGEHDRLYRYDMVDRQPRPRTTPAPPSARWCSPRAPAAPTTSSTATTSPSAPTWTSARRRCSSGTPPTSRPRRWPRWRMPQRVPERPARQLVPRRLTAPVRAATTPHVGDVSGHGTVGVRTRH